MSQRELKQKIAAKMAAGEKLTYEELEAALAFCADERDTFHNMMVDMADWLKKITLAHMFKGEAALKGVVQELCDKHVQAADSTKGDAKNVH